MWSLLALTLTSFTGEEKPMEFNEYTSDDHTKMTAAEMMRDQLEATNHIPESHRLKAMVMSIHPAIHDLVEPMAQAIHMAMEDAPKELPEGEAQAMLYHDLISTILMGLLIRVKAEMQSEGIGCFHARESTVEDPISTLIQQDIAESQDELDIASMKTAEMLKMLGLQDDKPS